MILNTTRIVTGTVLESGLVGVARSVDVVTWAISEVAVGIVVSFSKARRALFSRRPRTRSVAPVLRLVQGGRRGARLARVRPARGTGAALRAIRGGRGIVRPLPPHSTPHEPVSGAVRSGAGVPS